MYNDLIKKINSQESNYIPSQVEIEEILIFIGKEFELTSKIYKCYEYIQSKFIQSPRLISSMEKMLKRRFGEIILSNNINLRDYTMNMLIGLFFKLEDNYEVFLEIYFNNILSPDFVIEDRNKKAEDNFYLEYLGSASSEPFEANYRRMLYAYESIDKKAFVMSNNAKIFLIIQRLFSAYSNQLIKFILVIMCFKIKPSLSKFEIEQERTFFRLCYTQRKDDIDLIDIIFPAFDSSIHLANRKVLLFSILILFNSIGPGNFHQLLNRVNQDINKYIDFIQKSDMSIMAECIAHLYPYLDTSKTYQHCFECIVGDLTTCEDEFPSEANTNPLTIMTNLMACLELFVAEYKRRECPLEGLYSAYFEIQLLVIKFFNPYGLSKLREKYNSDFIAEASIFTFNELLKSYEAKHPLICAFIDGIDVCNIRSNSLIYQNWLTLIYKNFALYDTYKVIRKFLFKTTAEKGLCNLIKLPTELNKYNTITWKRILDSVLEDAQDLSSEERLNLIVNLKMLFYHEMSLTYPGANVTFDSLTYDYSAIVSFLKTKFDILVGFFFCFLTAKATHSEAPANHMDLDSAFDSFMFGSPPNQEQDDKMLIDVDENNAAIQQKRDDSIESKTKIEILNIYCLIISSYSSNDRIAPSFSKFAIDLIEMLIKQEEAPIVLNYITKVVSLIIKLDIANTKSSLHPIHTVFSNVIRHVIMKILKTTSNREQTKRYYTLLLSITTSLKDQPSLDEVKQGIVYAIKQMVYKNVDSQNYRNPLVVKNMVGLNDIDSKVVEKRYIIELLSLLSKEEQSIMFGFYIRFLSFGAKEIKMKKANPNIPKLLKLLIDIDWLPRAYMRLVNVLQEEGFVSKEKFLLHCINYLTDVSPLRSVTEKAEREIEDKKKLFQLQFRNILYDNACVIKAFK